MSVMPIPDELLGDSLYVIVPTQSGSYEMPVSNIRVERSENIDGYSSNNPRARSEITVWVDYHNSYYHSLETDFPVGAKVRYNGEIFEITEQKVYHAGTPHHCKFKAIRIGDDSV